MIVVQFIFAVIGLIAAIALFIVSIESIVSSRR